jgi:hypothetical protein
VIRVYDEAGNVIETHKHKGPFKRVVTNACTRAHQNMRYRLESQNLIETSQQTHFISDPLKNTRVVAANCDIIAREIYMSKTKIHLLASILTTALVCSPLAAHAAPPPPNPYQTRNMNYGVSGGNVNNITHAFCCSGTLGSLVSAGGIQYILSNNHILADQDQAQPGENISQPGLVDTGCQPATTVANFTTAVPLGNNVDCAIAAVISGEMNSTGDIEGIGIPSINVKPPAVGLMCTL